MASDFPLGVAFDTYHIHMIDDRWKRGNAGPGAERLELLRALQVRLAAIQAQRSLATSALNVPEGFSNEDNELQHARAGQFHQEQRQRYTSTVEKALNQFTAEQRGVFDEILAEIIAEKPAVFDIRGRAGSGKKTTVKRQHR